MIELNSLNKSYINGANKLHVLKDIDLKIESGEMVSIMGSSGSGKSTMMNVIGILDNYDAGTYQLNGRLIQNLNEKEAAQYRNELIGFIFQSFNLITFKNAVENVALPLYYRGTPRKKRNLIAMEYLDRVGLKNWADHLPNQLSGGQKQRVAIARALAADPALILADEPTGALDSETSHSVMDLLDEVNAEGKTIVIVTHEDDIAQRTKRVIRLKDGRIENTHTI